MSDSAVDTSISSNVQEVRRFIKNIQSSCRKLDSKQLEEEVQEEISRLVVLLQRIEKLILITSKRKLIQRELSILVDFLELAAESLFQTVPNIHFTTSLRIDIERVIYRYEHPVLGFAINRFIDAYRSPSTSIKVLFGLVTATFLYGTITISIIGSLGSYLLWYGSYSETGQRISKVTEEITNINIKQELKQKALLKDSNVIGSTIEPSLAQKQVELSNLKRLKYLEVGESINFFRQLVWAISAGTLGSIISILIRIEEFQGRKYSDRIVPFLTGLFKPIIGASFGILFFTLINSQLVVISGISDKETGSGNKKEFLVFAICFVVGFSERLARDVIGKAENVLGSSNQISLQSKQTDSFLTDSRDGSAVQQTTQENTLELKQEAASSTSDTDSKKRDQLQLLSRGPLG